ncbi:MAG: DUF1501 domain-containing protein [Planctomycetaceae bacterium]
MLSISQVEPVRTCGGYSRRELLRVGGLGLGGLTLPRLLSARAQADSAKLLRDKSVVFLFLQGGPSHIELFDPKMTAPSEFHSVTGEVSTCLPGITFGGSFSQLAQRADRLAVVRSYASGNSGHTYQKVASANNPAQATMGAVFARVAGANHPQTGVPNNLLVLPEAVQTGLNLKTNFETSALPGLTAPGTLGRNSAAFNPVGGGQLKQNMELKIPAGRFEDRRILLRQLDRIRRSVDERDALGGVDTYQRQAFDVIARGVADAFDLSKESAETIARYDTSSLFRNSEIQKWGDMRRSTNLLGQQMLLARRLCEAGCGFVTVSDCGWDMHSNGNSPKNLQGMDWLGPQVDHAVAAFIDDLEQRGLTDRVLLVVTGEMGRTPRINKNGGRDHYGNLTSLLFAGGGLSMGQVIGQSDRHATAPLSRRFGPEHMLSVIMRTLFDIGELRLSQRLPRDLTAFIDGADPIDGLL